MDSDGEVVTQQLEDIEMWLRYFRIFEHMVRNYLRHFVELRFPFCLDKANSCSCYKICTHIPKFSGISDVPTDVCLLYALIL